MFPSRYFPDRYFAPRYWPKVGEDSAGGITHPGEEFTVPTSRLHFTCEESRLHFTAPNQRLHWTVEE